jgi:hypothetical protein
MKIKKGRSWIHREFKAMLTEKRRTSKTSRVICRGLNPRKQVDRESPYPEEASMTTRQEDIVVPLV